ncbi:hypothetical protein [Aquibacillus kalidii]|uniref:hypothetical protein n=1 Tax=Aquibacillus kalidii TaxID=2762597 RepID=UPI001644427C|nr:hypothetical protein [Aquibacillus kalidii]
MGLTQTQRNFREFQKEQGNYKKYRNKKRLGFGTGLIILILASILFQLPQRIYNEYQIYHHQKMKSYLDNTKEYSNFITLYVNPLTQDLPNVNLEWVQNMLTENNRLGEEIESLKPVSGFKEHHEGLVEFTEQIGIYLREIERIGMTSNYDYDYMKHLSDQINVAHSQMKSYLVKGFQSEDIPYRLKEDGSYEYTIKTRYGEIEDE